MSLKGSRRSSKMKDDGELFSECKAAFLTEYDDINDRIESKRKLVSLLQISGRNLTTSKLNKLWTTSTSYLSFSDFVDICSKEKATSSDELMKAFQRIDINGDGYLSLDELYKIMSKKGEGMTRDEVRKMIAEVDDNDDGKLDYKEFTNMVMKTTEESKKMSMKVMEKKERKRRKGELSAAKSDADGNISDPIVTLTSNKTESQVSLKRDHEEDPEQGDITRSKVSLRSERRSSKASVKETSHSENLGSSVSIQILKVKSSTTSLRSETHTKAVDDDIKTSKVSLREYTEKVTESKTSLKSSVRGSRTGSKASVREEQGSHVSLASKMKESLDPDDNVTESAKRPGSASSQRSQSSKQEDVKSAKLNQPRNDTSTGHLSSPKPKDSGPSKSEPVNKTVSPKRETSSFSSSLTNITNTGDGTPRSKPDSGRHTEFENLSIRTPRSKLGIPSITTLERPGSSYKTDSMAGAKDIFNLDNSITKDFEGSSPFKLNVPKDSARSVGEEIDHDDDYDIVSTGRSTPRVSLSTRRGDTPKAETPKRDTPKGAKTESVEGKDKGKSLDKSTASMSTSMHGVINGGGKDKSDEMPDRDRNGKTTRLGDSKKLTDDRTNGRNWRTAMSDESKEQVADKTKDKSKKDDRDKKDKELGYSGLKEGQGQKKLDDHLKREQFDDNKKPAESDNLSKSQSEKKPPSGKEGSLGSPPASRKDDEKSPELKSKSMLATTKSNDTDVGSQSSLRSGDKEAGVPVPSPRKSVTRGTEDEMPRPSPRVRPSKTKSPSSSLRSKLPDARSLQDWYHYTSKGCFFYEEDEIVSHVYSLKLQDDSVVYLSANPINEPSCLNLPGSEPVDTALYVFDSRGNVVAFTEQRDIQGTYGIKLELTAGDYQILPYTTGCRFKQRADMSANMKDSKLVKRDKDNKVVITTAFRKALEDIFDLCDLDDNATMSKDEFNWFNVRTSGEELGDDEWEVVEEKTTLENGEITKAGFIELNELEAEDAEGEVDDLWITLTSMGMNKSLIMDEACPYRLNVYVKEVGRKKPKLRVTGIESLEKREFVTGICQSLIEKSGEPTSIRRMKDLYLYTYKNDYRATMVIDNRSRSTVSLEIDCSKSRNLISNRAVLDHTFEIDAQQTAIAHHLMPKSETSDWTVVSTETIHK